MKKEIKLLFLIFCGCLTLVMKLFVPVGGGGISLIFVISVPFLLGLGIVFSLIYHFLVIKLKSHKVQKIIFFWMLIILIGLSLLFYPYAN
jgi:hypothetical protein